MKKVVFASLLGLAALNVQAGVVLVGNPAASELSKNEASKLFLGKMKKLPWGGKPEILELQDGDPLRVEFHQKVTGKSESQLQSYWSRLVFTGKATAPANLASGNQVKQKVSTKSNAVGYIDEADVDGSVKILFKP